MGIMNISRKNVSYFRELRAKKLLKLLKMIILLTALYQFNQLGLLTPLVLI